jgi:hypothetical protein
MTIQHTGMPSQETLEQLEALLTETVRHINDCLGRFENKFVSLAGAGREFTYSVGVSQAIREYAPVVKAGGEPTNMEALVSRQQAVVGVKVHLNLTLIEG